eukprot:1185910-Prorocentrum_minimum.AAC.2
MEFPDGVVSPMSGILPLHWGNGGNFRWLSMLLVGEIGGCQCVGFEAQVTRYSSPRTVSAVTTDVIN